MTNIPEEQRIDNENNKRFTIFMKRFAVNKLLRSVGVTKEKGVTVGLVFVFLLGLVFTRKNLYETMTVSREKPPFSKNTVYRFLLSAAVNWEVFICRLSSSIIPEINKLTTEARKTALILDDTPYWRNRSKKVEMLSRCYDHSEKKYYKGFVLLNLGWTDGQSYMPVDFRLLASGKDKNLLEGSHVKEDKRTIATRRRGEARAEKPALALQMLKNTKGTPAQAEYVLFDSWFASPSFILSVKSLGYNVVARIKNHENYRYLYNGEKLSLSKIYQANRKRRGRSRYLLSVNVEVRHDDFESTVSAKIVFVRDRNNRKKWIALISTDITLQEDEIITLYGKRWDIEPFHKVLKSTLRLTKEFQLRSFDAIAAHTAIVLTRYIFLSLENRENKDDRSIGGLFFYLCEELADISFQCAFELLLTLLEQCLLDYYRIDKERVDQLVEHFIACLPSSIKNRLAS
jgi:hypothetical protein